jgi:hypothetical protein
MKQAVTLERSIPAPLDTEARFGPDDVRRLLDRAPDVVFRYRVRPPAGFDYISDAVTRVTGYSPQEHYAHPELIETAVHPDDRPIVREVLERGSSDMPVIVRWLHRDRTPVWVEQRITSIFDGRGRLFAVEAIAREIPDPAGSWRKAIRVVDDLRIDLDRSRVFSNGEAVHLTPSEFRLLVLLTDEPGRVVSRRTMMEVLWESAHVGDGRACEVHV